MKNYKYKITINLNDKEKKEVMVDTKDEICNLLKITPSVLHNKLSGRLKNNLNYVDIERVFVGKTEEMTIEEKRARQREYNKKFQEKIKAKKEEENKTKIETEKKDLIEHINTLYPPS